MAMNSPTSSALKRLQRELTTQLPGANIRAISTKADADNFMDMLGVFRSNPPARGAKEMLQGYNTMPWLRAVVDKVGSSIAATTWRAFVKTKTNDDGEREYAPYKQLQHMRFQERKDEIFRLKAAGELVEIEDYPLIDALYATGPSFTGYTTRELSQKWLDLVGEAFWIKQRNNAGMPIDFVPVPPHWVTNTPNAEKDYFELQPPSGKPLDVTIEDMIWFYHPNPHDPYSRGSGMGVTLGDELETDEYAAKFMKTFFYNSARPDVLISSASLKKEDTDRLEKRWVDKLRGWRRSFLPFFMNRDITVHPLGTDYSHLDMLDLRKWERDTVIQVYGVPPETLGIVEASNRATSEVAEYLYARWVLVPRLEFIRQILQHHLVPDYDEKVILDYDSPVAQDKEHILKVATIAPWSRELDEWREMQGLLPLSDGLGKVFMKPLNYEAITAEDLANPPSQQGDDDVPPDQDPENEPVDVDEPDEEVEEAARWSWPELLTNVISRQRVAPRIGTRKEQVAAALRSAFAELADDARGRVVVDATAVDLATFDRDVVTVAMAPVIKKLTSVYVLAAEQAKADLALFVEDEDGIDKLEPLHELMGAKATAEGSIITAIDEALSAIASAVVAEGLDPEVIADLLADGVGISAADAEEFVQHGGQGDEVLPLYEKFADMMADHAITHMANRAQEALWSGAAREGILNSDKVSRVWISRLGCRSCNECSGLDGETTSVGVAWNLPNGGTVVTPTEAHSECHCTERLVRKEARNEAGE